MGLPNMCTMPSRQESQRPEPTNTGGDPAGTGRGGHNLPEEYIHLSEIGAPAPIKSPFERPIYRHQNLEDRIEAESSSRCPRRPPSHGQPRHSTSISKHVDTYMGRSYQSQSVEQKPVEGAGNEVPSTPYQTPEAYANLTEVRGAWPVENPDEAHLYRHHSFEEYFDGRHRPSVAAPVGAPYPQPPTAQVPQPGRARTQIPRVMTELYTISYLVFFSLLGSLARIGLQSLTVFPGSLAAFGSLWPTYAGSAVLGFLTEFSGLQQRRGPGKETAKNERFGVVDSRFPADTDSGQNSGLDSGEDDIPAAVRRPAPLYIGLATGFCGSFTTFSGFMMDIFLALSDSPFTSADNTEVPRHGVGRGIMAILAVTFLTISACLSALKLGAHVAILVDRLDLRWRRVPPLKYLDRAMIALAWGSWAGAVLLALFPPDRETWRPVLFSLVLAPLGCLVRFYVSIKLNTIFPAFPLGTFTVNFAGTAVFGMAWDLQHASAVGIAGSLVSCQLLQGVMGGVL